MSAARLPLLWLQAPHPIEALPGFCRLFAAFVPLRQITGGIRSILGYDPRATWAWPGASGVNRSVFIWWEAS
ncbi:hypothetical protein [Streptomyces canus]|nr:hypothetical protein [Streptomyces canus]